MKWKNEILQALTAKPVPESQTNARTYLFHGGGPADGKEFQMVNPPDVIPVKCGLGSLTHWYRRMHRTDVYMYEGAEDTEHPQQEHDDAC